MPRSVSRRSADAKGNLKKPRAAVKQPAEPQGVFRRGFFVFEPPVKLTELPTHPLSTPPGWSRGMAGDWETFDCEFLTRRLAIHHAGCLNAERLDRASEDDLPDSWAYVFEIGEIEPESFVNIEGGVVAILSLHTTISLVRPTADEIAEAEGRAV